MGILKGLFGRRKEERHDPLKNALEDLLSHEENVRVRAVEGILKLGFEPSLINTLAGVSWTFNPRLNGMSQGNL